MDSQNDSNGIFLHKELSVSGRLFFIRMQRFDNGMFVSIHEGNAKIGSLIVSMISHAGAPPITTTIIPPVKQSSLFFMRMTAEQVSTRMGGISIVSIYIKNEIDVLISKTLLDSIVEMTTYEKKDTDD